MAVREFGEETGRALDACAPGAAIQPLGSVRQRGGKQVTAWAIEGNWPDDTELVSNTFEIEWPPRSGQRQRFPEVDRGGFFPLEEARRKLNPAQVELLERLLGVLAGGAG